VRWCRQCLRQQAARVGISHCCHYSWKSAGQQLLLGGRMRGIIQEATTIPSLPLSNGRLGSPRLLKALQGPHSIFSTFILSLYLLRNLR